MKIRIFKKLVDGVFDVRIQTEDWSENDRSLMVKYGEPEIDLGGLFTDESGEEPVSYTLDDVHARILTESPFTRKFDSRDLGSVANAKAIAGVWSSTIEDRIADAVMALRANADTFNTEEISEY